MSWLRLDDGFADHPKLGSLSDREFRVWVRVMCYCARYRDPTVDKAVIAAVNGLDAKRVARFEEIGLLDRHNGCHVVHDWLHYAPKDPSGAERQARWRASKNGDHTDDFPPPEATP